MRELGRCTRYTDLPSLHNLCLPFLLRSDFLRMPYSSLLTLVESAQKLLPCDRIKFHCFYAMA